MLLTITTTHRPATDLGYLLHKRPGRVQSFDLSFGQVHVFYPETAQERCTAALLLDIDPVGLVRGRRGPGQDGTLDQYVNDRPYSATSLMSVAIAQVYGTALGGRSQERQELADTSIPLEARLAVLPCRQGEEFIRRLFEPLGYAVELERHALETHFPEWGDSPYYTVTLRAELRLYELLSHLYVLIPVLDNEKHYWVGDDEVDKLLRHGEGWLSAHPERESIARRYLKWQPSLARQAIARLAEEDEADPDEARSEHDVEEASVEASQIPPVGAPAAPGAPATLSLNEQRLGTVLAVLKRSGARRVLDLGCGEGKLLRTLLHDRQFEEIVGLDVSTRALEVASDRLHLDRLPDRQRQRIRLLHGAMTYRDARLDGFDAAAAVEVIEHLDAPRLAAFERVLFEFARPRTVVITTPSRKPAKRAQVVSQGRKPLVPKNRRWTKPPKGAKELGGASWVNRSHPCTTTSSSVHEAARP